MLGRHAWLFKGALHLALVGATLGLTALCASYLGSQALVMACAIGVDQLAILPYAASPPDVYFRLRG